jgi:hypothetical protein
MRRLLVLAVTASAALPARAHVAPSVDDNNRYIKLTPQGDRVRLAYTVFFGEVPGAQTRPSIDGNHDRTISDAEAQTFGNHLAAEVAAALDVNIDGTQHPVTWNQVAVGINTPSIAAGSFSVDMIAYLCLGSGPHHRVQVRDRFRLLRPGETEVKVEDSPGIAIEHARVGPADDPSHDYRFVGPGGPVADDGLDLAFTVSAKAPVGGEGCKAAAGATSRGGGSLRILWFAILAAVGLVAAGFGLWWWRRR